MFLNLVMRRKHVILQLYINPSISSCKVFILKYGFHSLYIIRKIGIVMMIIRVVKKDWMPLLPIFFLLLRSFLLTVLPLHKWHYANNDIIDNSIIIENLILGITINKILWFLTHIIIENPKWWLYIILIDVIRYIYSLSRAVCILN